MSDKNLLDAAIESILEEQRNSERERAEKGKRFVVSAILLIAFTILGSALLGVAIRVFLQFSGLG